MSSNKLLGGNSVINRPVVDSWYNFHMADTNAPITQDSVIKSFQIYAKRAQGVQMIIYRQEGGRFKVIGKSQMVNARLGVNTIQLTTPIKAKKGDLIGWYVPKKGVIAFTYTGDKSYYGPIGGTATDLKWYGNRIYSISVNGELPVEDQSEMIISFIYYQGEEEFKEGDEYVQITNVGEGPGDISGFRINAEDKGLDFVFPTGIVLEKEQSVRVYTNKINESTGGFTYASETEIWNNKGDVARLFNAANELVDEYGYGDTEQGEMQT